MEWMKQNTLNLDKWINIYNYKELNKLSNERKYGKLQHTSKIIGINEEKRREKNISLSEKPEYNADFTPCIIEAV